jgi:hypothetical protein
MHCGVGDAREAIRDHGYLRGETPTFAVDLDLALTTPGFATLRPSLRGSRTGACVRDEVEVGGYHDLDLTTPRRPHRHHDSKAASTEARLSNRSSSSPQAETSENVPPDTLRPLPLPLTATPVAVGASPSSLYT